MPDTRQAHASKNFLTAQKKSYNLEKLLLSLRKTYCVLLHVDNDRTVYIDANPNAQNSQYSVLLTVRLRNWVPTCT